MVNPSTSASSFATLEETSSVKSTKTNKKIKSTTRNKKKISKEKTSKQPLEFSCYQDLRSRDITKNNDITQPVNAFIAKTKIFNNTLKKEEKIVTTFRKNFPSKSTKDFISPELDNAYEKLAQVYSRIRNNVHDSDNALNKDLVGEIIVDLINIKQEIIQIWNKYNLKVAYKYGNLKDDGSYRLEDLMMDFIQCELFTCYSAIDDEENKQLIISQIIEQKSIISNNLLLIKTVSDLSNYDYLDKINFNDTIAKFAEIEIPRDKVIKGKQITKRNRYSTQNQFSVIAIIFKLLLDKTKISLFKLYYDNTLLLCFLNTVGTFISEHTNNKYYIEDIKKLSSALDFYFSYLDTPPFKQIHATILTEHGINFLQKFNYLLRELYIVLYKSNKIKGALPRYKDRLAMYKQIATADVTSIQEKIEQLFIKYNIPIADINSWYDTFVEENFRHIFINHANRITNIAQLIELSKNAGVESEEEAQQNAKDRENINIWLDILANDYKNLIDDKISWDGIPRIIIYLSHDQMMGESIRFTFGDYTTAKQENIAKLHSKITQLYSPFLGTALLAFVNKDSYDDLLANMDMLEFISTQTGTTKYINSSKYLIAQLSSYLIAKNDKLDFTKKQLLFAKAEKLYLEIASSGTSRAYLLLAETLATLAKEKMYAEDFSEAAKLYDQASSYCQILSEVTNLETDLQNLALINMNCFKAEADVLRKIKEEQISLLKELETPQATTKNKKKSNKKKTDIITKTAKPELAEEITIKELVNWQQTYKPDITKPKSITTTKTSKTKAVTALPLVADINSKRDLWRNVKSLMASTNLETSHSLLVELINNNYFKILEAKFKDGITQKDSWVVLFVYQSMAYHHFLQIKYAQEVSNNVNKLKLFNVSEGKTNTATKAKKITFANLYTEADDIIRQAITLVCLDIADIATKDIREIMLLLSPENYDNLPLLHKNQLAAIVSTYGHLTSIDDIAHGRKGKFRLAAKLYDKADEINPNRLIRKQQLQQAS